MRWPLSLEISRIIERALDEDIGSGDLASSLLFAQEVRCTAVIQAKRPGVLAGLPVAEGTFKKLACDVTLRCSRQDGEKLIAGEAVAKLDGPLRAILTGERV